MALVLMLTYPWDLEEASYLWVSDTRLQMWKWERSSTKAFSSLDVDVMAYETVYGI